MYFVYILYSYSGKKTYVGYSGNIERRLVEHNITEIKGYTLRYRPWVLARSESYNTKAEAMLREKFLKTGRGREEIKLHVQSFLNRDGAVSAGAEKD